MMNKHETTVVCFQAPFFATLDECTRGVGKSQDARRGGNGGLWGQTSALACLSDGRYFSCCKGDFSSRVRLWLVTAPVQEEIKRKLIAAVLRTVCGVEVLPSLGLNANPAASSCLGPRGEEIQPAWGSHLSDTLAASTSRTPRCRLQQTQGLSCALEQSVLQTPGRMVHAPGWGWHMGRASPLLLLLAQGRNLMS